MERMNLYSSIEFFYILAIDLLKNTFQRDLAKGKLIACKPRGKERTKLTTKVYDIINLIYNGDDQISYW